MKRDLSRPIQEVILHANADHDGERLDHFLCDAIFWRSRTDLQDRIRRGRVTVNGLRAKPALRLRRGDVVRIEVDLADLPDQDPAAIELSVIEEDDDMIVIDKQPGLVVHPTGRHVYDTLMNALHLRFRGHANAQPHVVHRLDRNTSGVICVAKTATAKQFLQNEFEARRPRKAYLALCEGEPREDRGVVDLPLGRDETARVRIKMTVRPDAAPSRTSFEVIERFGGHCLIRAWPQTGRQHQIRVHLSALGHPIVADPLYGDPRSAGVVGAREPLLRRQGLHAESLTIRHPRDGKERTYRAKLADDMAQLIRRLRDGDRMVKFDDEQSARWD